MTFDLDDPCARVRQTAAAIGSRNGLLKRNDQYPV
jgi:hypothetical protein